MPIAAKMGGLAKGRCVNSDIAITGLSPCSDERLGARNLATCGDGNQQIATRPKFARFPSLQDERSPRELAAGQKRGSHDGESGLQRWGSGRRLSVVRRAFTSFKLANALIEHAQLTNVCQNAQDSRQAEKAQ